MPRRDWPMRKSAMQSFKYCERYFYYAWIEGIPAPYQPYLAQLGSNFHANSAEFYDIIDINKEPTYDYYRSLLPRTITETNEWYDKFARFEVFRMKHILRENLEPRRYFLPVAKELFINLEDENMEGKIDRIWRMEDDTPLIQDVKPKLSKARTSLRRELCFYVYLATNYEPLFDEWGPFENVSGYGYHEAEVWVEKVNERTQKAMFTLLDLIDYYITTREHKSEWERNVYAFCADCPYNYDCWVAEGLDIPMPDLRKSRGEEGEWQRYES